MRLASRFLVRVMPPFLSCTLPYGHFPGEMLLRLPAFVPATASYSRVWVPATVWVPAPGVVPAPAPASAATRAAAAAAAAAAASIAPSPGASTPDVAGQASPAVPVTPAPRASQPVPVAPVVPPVPAHWRVLTVESRLYVLQGDISIAYAPFCRFCRIVAHPSSSCFSALATEQRRVLSREAAPVPSEIASAAQPPPHPPHGAGACSIPSALHSLHSMPPPVPPARQSQSAAGPSSYAMACATDPPSSPAWQIAGTKRPGPP